MLPCHLLVHGKSHVPVREVSCRSATQLGNVKGLGKVHLEQRALAESHGQQIKPGMRIARSGNLPGNTGHPLHRGVVTGVESGLLYVGWRIVPVLLGKALFDLGAATVAMHIAEST